jgi:cysteine desulfurase
MSTSKRTYLDYNATSPLRPQARDAMLGALEAPGNAASVHAEGRRARGMIEAARAAVAALVGGDSRFVTFTSGATEANQTVLTPDWHVASTGQRFDVLLASAIEHPAVLSGGRFGTEALRKIPVHESGVVDTAALEAMLLQVRRENRRALVSVMLANNETGVVQPVAEVARLAHAHGAIVHTDAVQAAGRIPIDVAALGVDVLTLSSHKIGGPQGAGAIVRAGDMLGFAPLMLGGGQENRLRGGTENVAAIAGFGTAARAAVADLEKAGAWRIWRDELAAIVSEGRKAVIFGAGEDRLPQTLCFAVEGIAAETLLIALDLNGVAVSSGAACSSGKVSQSHVLAAMNVPAPLAKCALRLSFGWATEHSDLDSFASGWKRVLSHVAPGEIQAA